MLFRSPKRRFPLWRPLLSGSAFSPVFHWSGIYGDARSWEWESVDGGLGNFLAYFRGYWSKYPVLFILGIMGIITYYVCRFGPVDSDASDLSIDEDSGWIEVWVWTRSLNLGPSVDE